ncbi:MAG: divalent metal cation transporter [Roseiarcus sp.]|jgi:NRAMP (natural resistance-associated macrophage protein)-like metal ion transporter
MTSGSAALPLAGWRRFLLVAGPGLVVMLADTDAGSVITAAQSGAQWGYRLLALQFLLIPILYIVQELTVRLGVVTGKGHAELIAQHFGRYWAWFSVATLIVSCIGALLSELSGIAGVGALMGVPVPLTLALVVSVLLIMAFTHSYLTVERVAIVVGGFELVFLLVAWMAHPSPGEIASGALSIPLRDPKYLYLASANIGAVIMPWMVFFQQSSIVEKKLTTADLGAARLDTASGAVLTQLIMAAVLVAVAATLGKAGGDHALDTVQEISQAITPFLGKIGGDILFALGMSGAALVATIVVTLTAARTLAEVAGVNHSLDHEPGEAPWFYGAYAAALVVGAVIVASGVNLVALSVGVQVMNALLLPIVLTFLFLLARRLPKPFKLRGAYAWVAAALIAATTLFGVYAGVAGLWG